MKSRSHDTSRRTFLTAAGCTALGLSVAPARLFAQEKSGEDEILGHNGHRYRIVPEWGKLDPEKHPVKDCHGMVQDSQGRIILLTNNTKNNLLIYNKAGELLETWGHDYPGAHGLSTVSEDGEDFLWITDHDRHQVYKTTLEGELVMKLGYPEESGKYENAGQFKPTKVAVAPDGRFFVCDGYGLSYVSQYSPEGEFVRIFGGRGEEPKNLVTPHGATVDTRDPSNPVLIIASRGQHALKRFTLDGEHIDTIPMPGARVCDLAQHEGDLYVPNLNGFVSILNEDNRVVSNPGGNKPVYKNGELQPLSKQKDVFVHPHSIMVDDEDNVYVPQWNSNQTYPIKLERVRQ